eukprot:scaffold1667_cov258-Pinguiococcus_pyrenoidosus.AAC.25
MTPFRNRVGVPGIRACAVASPASLVTCHAIASSAAQAWMLEKSSPSSRKPSGELLSASSAQGTALSTHPASARTSSRRTDTAFPSTSRRACTPRAPGCAPSHS